MPSIAIGTEVLGPNSETYAVSDFLGQGAFGEVYRAVGTSSGRVVAVKLLPQGLFQSNVSKTAILNEIRAAQQVHHPNVVEILHVNAESSSIIGPYVFMEYVSGGTLAKIIKATEESHTQIPLPRALEMMIDVAQGARAINEKLIHRDIKPDNILVEDNALKIGDFGISKLIEESTRSETFKGQQHVAYMAPEAWQHQTNTVKIDVYSVGLVFHQILTSQHPLLSMVKDPGNFLDWENVHLYAPCPDVRDRRKDVPLSVAQLLSRMVSKRPQERPDWAEVLKTLSQPELSVNSPNPSITAAVEAAVARKRSEDATALATAKRHDERQKQVGLYAYSCERLVGHLDGLVEEFNSQFQHGQITKEMVGGTTVYSIPHCLNIEVTFFRPTDAGPKIRNQELIGGGWIGLSNGRSANLLLLRAGSDDLYGQWSICEVGISAVVDGSRLIGQFGLTERTVVPFGFKDAYFYDQIRYASGGMHVFTYHFADSVADFFAQLLLDACS